MNSKDIRRVNLYLNSRLAPLDNPNIVTGKMGSRDRNTGRYLTTLNNQGVVPTRYIGRSNAQPQGYSTEIDLQGWGDS